jgi:broad specificity phosphatase PhoE
MIQIILVRHGRTAWNIDEGRHPRFRGTVDLPLTEQGIAQAQATAHRLATEPLTAVYSSPLQRSLHTAQSIAEPHGLAVQTLPGLSSMNYGAWAGMTLSEVASRWPELYRQWRYDPFSIQIPGGDNTADLCKRVVAATCEAVARHRDGETIVVVTHQVVTKTLVCTLAGLPNAAYWQVHQDLCNLTRFEYHPTGDQPFQGPRLCGGSFHLACLNDNSHLDSALPSATSNGTRIFVIRHGQTAWNEGAGQERFRGRTDLPLDDVGHAQAQALAARLDHEPIAAVYTSPLLRTRQTITPLAEKLHSPGIPVNAHPGLFDIDYGRFQGLTHAEASKTFPEQYALWRTTPSRTHFPQGERLADVQGRLLSLLDEMTTRHPGQTVALVGHQIVNKVLSCTLLGLDLDQIWRIRQDTASIDVFQQVKGVWHTLRLNDTYHLGSGR